MNKIRWGLMSTANINRKVIPAIRASARGELVAVASRDQQKAKQYARKWNIPKTFGSYEALLDSGEIDAVYVSLPNHLHAEWSIRAMQAGVHVLCEKPLAIRVDEVDRMAETSRQTGRFLAEAFMYQHHPQTIQALEIVRSGQLGEVLMVNGAFHFDMSKRQGNVRLVPEWGGGALWDVGIYPLSFARLVYGAAPLIAAGMGWSGESGVDEIFTGSLRFPGGGLSHISCSFRSPFYTFAEIIGSEGHLWIERPFIVPEEGGKMTLTCRNDSMQEIHTPAAMLYLGEIEDLHAAILDGKAPRVSLEQSRDHVRSALALYASSRTNKAVNV